MKVSDIYTSHYLKASSIKPGPHYPRTIDRAVSTTFTFNNQTSYKLVLWLKPESGKPQKGIVLSKKNAEQIADILGDDEIDNWKGKLINIGTRSVESGANNYTVWDFQKAG